MAIVISLSSSQGEEGLGDVKKSLLKKLVLHMDDGDGSLRELVSVVKVGSNIILYNVIKSNLIKQNVFPKVFASILSLPSSLHPLLNPLLKEAETKHVHKVHRSF